MNRKRLITSGFCLMMLCALLVGSVGAAADGVGEPAAPAASNFTITIDSPTNNSYSNANDTTVHWTVSNFAPGLNWTELNLFTAGSWVGWTNETTHSSQDLGRLANGTYFVNVRTVNDSGPQNLANVTFTVDRVAPTVEVLFPTVNLKTNSTNITLAWTADGTGSPLDNFSVSVTQGVTHWVHDVNVSALNVSVGV
ncbi:MAG: hypothetical protein ABR879_07780, partial [Methanomassiliicoccales archaeon]